MRGGHGTRRTTAEAGPVMGSELRPRRRDRCHWRGLQTRPPRPRPTCGALPAGAVRAASLNGGRNACAPTSTITPAPSVPRSRVQPAGHSLHRRRAMASEIDQDHRRCTMTSARDNTGTFLRSAAAAAALRMYHLHPGASSSTRVGNVRSAPSAAAAGAAETAAAAAVEAAT